MTYTDIKTHKHGEEGTHYACAEIANSDGETTCCGCNNHECKRESNYIDSVISQFRERFTYQDLETEINFTISQDSTSLEDFLTQKLKEQEAMYEEAVPEKTIVPLLESGNLSDYHEGFNDCINEIREAVKKAKGEETLQTNIN